MRLTKLNPSIRVVVHERSVPLLEVGHNDLTHGGYWLNGRVRALAKVKKWLTPAWDLTFPPVRLREGDIVVRGERDDETLRELGVAGSILATPGHTVDSISVILDSGEAFVGDAAASFLGFAGTNHCVVFLTDLEEYYRSWDRLLASGARQILPAHGRPFASTILERERGHNPVGRLVRFEGL